MTKLQIGKKEILAANKRGIISRPGLCELFKISPRKLYVHCSRFGLMELIPDHVIDRAAAEKAINNGANTLGRIAAQVSGRNKKVSAADIQQYMIANDMTLPQQEHCRRASPQKLSEHAAPRGSTRLNFHGKEFPRVTCEILRSRVIQERARMDRAK